MNSETTKPRQPRRSQSEWKQLVEEHKQSDLSAFDFCEQRQIAYQSLIKWRGVFAKEKSQPDSTFIELTPKPASGSPFTHPNQSWDIELELGNQILLRIRQGT